MPYVYVEGGAVSLILSYTFRTCPRLNLFRKFTRLQVNMFTGLQAFESTSLQVYRVTCIQVYKFTSLQVYKFTTLQSLYYI